MNTRYAYYEFAAKALFVLSGAVIAGYFILAPLQAFTDTTLEAPLIVSPANGATVTSAQFTTADWTDVTGSSTPISYRFESSLSSSTDDTGAFTSPIYTSALLLDSDIMTSGTPPGTYYWHVRAFDAMGSSSPWSAMNVVHVVASTSTTTPIATTTDPTDESRCGRPGTNAFNACYYEGQNFETFKFNRTDAAINFDWGTGSPTTTVPADHFSAKWWGLFDFDAATYRFTVTADDGVRLSVDNQTIINEWRDQAATTYTYDKVMPAGQRGVIAEFYENTGEAEVRVSWQKLSTTTPGTPTTTPATTTPSTMYYPNAQPSQWYILPGQTLSINGTGFAPNETIRIEGETVSATATASGSGSFTSGTVLTVPFGWQNSTRTFMVRGHTSGAHATPDPITISVGTFYPQITPSSWWIGNGQALSVSGQGFAPNEQVRLLVNGVQADLRQADGSGNVTLNLTTPNSGLSASLSAQGVSSGQSSSRTIYLHP